MATAGKGAGAGAWGRFALVSKERPAESDHVYFSRAQHKIGRSAERCDIVLDLQYISSVHCVVELEGRTQDGVPVVRLEDKSRNGVWVNGDRVGKGNSAHLESGFTVHFTRPGLKATGVDPRIYKFEVLQLEIETKPEAVSVTQDLNASAFGSPQSTRLLSGGSPATKKRRRSSENNEVENEDPRDGRIRELASQLKNAKSHLAMATEAMTEINAKHELVLEKAASERHELVAQVKALVAQRQELAASAEELASKLSTAEAGYEQQRKSLQQQVTERDSELDALKTECDEAKRALEETETLLNERNKQLVALKAESSDLMKRLAASEKQSDAALPAAADSDDRQKAGERQRQLEETIAAMRRELDASRRRSSALEDKADRAIVATPTSEQSNAVSAHTNEVIERLQRQVAAASGFFKQIQALSEEGALSLRRTDGAIDDGVAAASSALGLLRGDRASPTSQPAESTVDVDIEPTAAQRASVAVGGESRSGDEAIAGVEEMEVEPDDDAAREEEPAETEEQGLPETEATKAHELDREQPEPEAEHHSDPGSNKSCGSRSTTLGSGDGDTE